MKEWCPKQIIDLYLISGKSLSEQAEKLNIPYEHRFNALEDALVAAEIYEAYKP